MTTLHNDFDFEKKAVTHSIVTEIEKLLKRAKSEGVLEDVEYRIELINARTVLRETTKSIVDNVERIIGDDPDVEVLSGLQDCLNRVVGNIKQIK